MKKSNELHNSSLKFVIFCRTLIIDYMLVLVKAVFVAPRSEEVGVAI